MPKAESDDESAQSSQKVAVSAKGPAVSASSKAHHLPLSSYSRKVRRDMLQGISATHENDVDESWKSLPRSRKTCRTKNDGDESWSSPTDMDPPTPEESDVESTQTKYNRNTCLCAIYIITNNKLGGWRLCFAGQKGTIHRLARQTSNQLQTDEQQKYLLEQQTSNQLQTDEQQKYPLEQQNIFWSSKRAKTNTTSQILYLY